MNVATNLGHKNTKKCLIFLRIETIINEETYFYDYYCIDNLMLV